MKMRRLAAGLALAVLAGCGALEDEGGDSPDAPAAAPAVDSSEASAQEAAQGAEAGERDPQGQRDRPPDSPIVLGRGGVPIEVLEPRTYLLQLVNLTDGPAVVYADAGAGRVVLDTVGSGDSSRVNIEVRAREVRLEASDLTSRALRAATISPRADSVTRWEIRR